MPMHLTQGDNSLSFQTMYIAQEPQGANFQALYFKHLLHDNLQKHATKLVLQNPDTFPFNFASL